MENKLESAFWFGVGIVLTTVVVLLLLCLVGLYLVISRSVYWFKRLTKGKEEAEEWLASEQREADLVEPVDFDGPRGAP